MKKQASSFMRFFWWCAGANVAVLDQCPETEHQKAAGIGATILFTGIMASLTGGYAMSLAFSDSYIAIPAGLFWGMVIFNLDRFMVSTFRKDQSFGRQIVQLSPRLLLAILLALTIAKPLELRIFVAEINEVLADKKQAKIENSKRETASYRSEKETSIATLLAKTEAKFQLREAHYQDYKCECDGTCGTGKRGRGSECARKEAKYLQTSQEYLDEKAANDQEIQNLREEIAALESSNLANIETIETTFSQGLLTRLDASSQLPSGPKLMIVFLIFLVEISPLLAKILSPIGAYELGLKQEQDQFSIDQENDFEASKTAKAHQQALEATEREVQIEQKRRVLQALSKAQAELANQQIKEWLLEEKLKKNKDHN